MRFMHIRIMAMGTPTRIYSVCASYGAGHQAQSPSRVYDIQLALGLLGESVPSLSFTLFIFSQPDIYKSSIVKYASH